MPNITQITPPRVSLIDERTGAVSREWYRFFYNLYYAIGGTTGGAIPPSRGGTGTTQIPANGDVLIGNGATGVYNATQIDLGDGLAKVSGPGSLELSNTGVLSIIAGDGISVDQPTGNVTITGTGVSGPFISTNNAIAVYDGVTGDKIKNSAVVINPTTNLLTGGIGGGTF